MTKTYDMHNHSKYSHDCTCDISELYFAQKNRGSVCFAITDHCDLHLSTDFDASECIKKCHDEIESFKAKNKEITEILKGIEIGEGIWYPKIANRITGAMDFDIILGSVHTVRSTKSCIPYSLIDFKNWSKTEISDYIKSYFLDIYETIDTFDFDVLTHLTCPLKYIPVDINLLEFDGIIEKILNKIIERSIALEINTSANQLIPNIEIIKKYYDLGGRLITVGSDAHISKNAARNFDYAYQLLKSTGFKKAHYYKKRQIFEYEL